MAVDPSGQPVVPSVASSSNSSSPWDEELPEEKPREQVMGGLGGTRPVQPVVTPPPSFVVPDNIDQNVGLTTVSPQNFPNAIATAEPKTAGVPVQSKSLNGDIKPAGVVPDSSASRTSPASPVPPVTQIPIDAAQNASTFPKPKARIPAFKNFNFFSFFIIVGFLALLGGAVLLTENGLLSIGIENVYGVFKIENLWGGLSINAEDALARSFVAAQNHPDFKVDGSITLTVDKSVDSPVTTPLVSFGSSGIGSIALLPMKAVLTADTTVWPSDGTTTSTGSTSTDSTSSTASSTSTATQPTAADQANQNPYQGSVTLIKDVSSDFSGFFDSSGNSLQFTIQKVIGSSIIELKNIGSTLWVKSDSIKFDKNETAANWVQYNLPPLPRTSVSNEIFSVNPGSGLSIRGARDGNEKINGTRCYRYNIDDITIGDSLSDLGIKSDEVQSITGTVWLGIRDKLPRRIDLKITMATSKPTTQIKVSVDFSDYDTANSFQAVAPVDTITPGGK